MEIGLTLEAASEYHDASALVYDVLTVLDELYSERNTLETGIVVTVVLTVTK